jgi:cytochrome P450
MSHDQALLDGPHTPTGVPHRLIADDVHAGYSIPAGSIVIPNIWSMLHSPDVYTNPLSFNPDRFMGGVSERDPREICFGFGRRICPGQHLADASVWLSCAVALAALRVRPMKDAEGREVLPEPEMTSGTISHPKPFQCEIAPRSERAHALVLSTAYAEDSDA